MMHARYSSPLEGEQARTSPVGAMFEPWGVNSPKDTPHASASGEALASAAPPQGGSYPVSLDARLLLQHVLGMSREALLLADAVEMTQGQEQAYQDMLTRRAAGEPVAKIVGRKAFWNHEFETNAHTLDPRPDTETVVEAVLEWINSSPLRGEQANVVSRGGDDFSMTSHAEICTPHRSASDKSPRFACSPPRGELKILDLGTGTGCLLLSLLDEYPNATGIGVDISPDALEVAKRNAGRLGLAGRATFLAGDWFSALEQVSPSLRGAKRRGNPESCHPGECRGLASPPDAVIRRHDNKTRLLRSARNDEIFDIIVSNPPYIPTRDIETLMLDVRDHDPRLALDGGADGLEAYRGILSRAGAFLEPEGIVVLEVGAGQSDAIAALGEAYGFAVVSVKNDLAGIPRTILLQDMK